MLRMASLAFVLRAGVKYSCKGSTPCHFRTVQATVDTILFQRLRLAEKDLFQMLQKLIFRSAGSLNRDQVYPVALVLWQLLRILSIASSHLLNIVQRFQSTGWGSRTLSSEIVRLISDVQLPGQQITNCSASNLSFPHT